MLQKEVRLIIVAKIHIHACRNSHSRLFVSTIRCIQSQPPVRLDSQKRIEE